MSDALILLLLGRSRKLAGLAKVYEAFLLAKSGLPIPVNVNGIRIDGDTYDLTGTVTKRAGE